MATYPDDRTDTKLLYRLLRPGGCRGLLCLQKMRFHFRKIVTYAITGFGLLLIVFNVYHHDIWGPVYHPQDPPWRAERAKRPLPRDDGKKIHDHVSLANRGKVLSVKNQDPLFRVNKSLSHEELGRDFALTIDAPRGIWLEWDHYSDDRIVAQMRHRPKSLIEAANEEDVPLKTILLYHGVGHWNIRKGQEQFKHQKCPVNRCTVTDDRSLGRDADAVMLHHSGARPWTKRPPHQVWILYMLESPYHTPGLQGVKDVFNWTATYRHDSTIVAPYEKFVPFNPSVQTIPQNKSYAIGKTKKVAWFVSNCGGRNGRREYATELSKYISVDIYGACGPLKCPRHNSKKCFDMLDKDYKFYLAFENSNCRDYITEKFFVNGLQHDVIPIVMGAAPEDYKRAAPPHSFIHVDEFESPQALAEYLHKLDTNDDLFNEYFQWKGTGSFVNTFFWCRLCAMVHEAQNHEPSQYKDLERWWRGPGVCIGQEKWRDRPRTSKLIIDNY